jgi:hypothetical protein
VFLHDHEPERALDFAQVRDGVRHAVVAERRAAALDEGMRAMRARARIEIAGAPE